MKQLFPLLFLLSLSALAQEQLEKKGKWIYYGKERPESGIPPEGNVGKATNGNDLKNGWDTNYFSNGTIRRIRFLEQGRPAGKYDFYYPNGQLKETGFFAKNQHYDSLKHFHENGNLEYEAWYNENGREQGTVNYYYPNGQLEFSYTSKNGTPTGNAKRYYENGDLKETIGYNEDGFVKSSEYFEPKNPLPDHSMKGDLLPPYPGKTPNTLGMKWNPNGNNKVYNADHEIWQDGVFQEGMLWNGKVFVYDNDGILLKVQLFQNGKYHSDGQL